MFHLEFFSLFLGIARISLQMKPNPVVNNVFYKLDFFSTAFVH